MRNSADDGGMLEYIRLAWSNRLLLAAIVFCCLVLGLMLSLTQQPVYRSSSAIEVLGVNDDFLNLKQLNPTGPISPDSVADSAELIREHNLLAAVVKKLGLDKDPVHSTEKPGLLGKMLGRQPKSGMEVALTRAGNSINVRHTEQSRIIRVFFDSTDPRLAANFLNTLVDEYIRKDVESRLESSKRVEQLLEDQLKTLRSNLERAENGMQAYGKGSGLLFTDEKNSVAEERLKQLQDELSRAQADRVAKQSQLEMASSAGSETLPQTFANLTAKQYQTKLTELRRELAELSTILTPTHYKVQKVQAQIAEVEKALQSELATTVKTIQNEYRSAMTRERLLQSEYQKQTESMALTAPRAAHYNTLKREVDSTRALHESMVQRVQESRIASAIRASNIRVVSRASVPDKPYKPNHQLNLALGLFSGIVLGFGVVIFRSKLRTTFRHPGDVSQTLFVAELGAVPSLSLKNGGAQRVSWREPLRLLSSGKDDRRQRELVDYEQPGPLLESFRSIAASILVGRHDGTAPRVLLVTSPGSKEGKTFISANLARTIARSGQSVLLIDADFRRPRLSRLFEVSGGKGFREILLGQLPVTSEALSDCIRSTSIPSLDILPVGGEVHEDPYYIHGPKVAAALLILKERYDLVLIDAPPALPVADARFLSRYVDAVVMVVRANKTRVDAVNLAVSRLYADALPVLGVILNDWDLDREHSLYYQAYGEYFVSPTATK